MARACDDPGLVIREPLGSCLLRVFNYYVDADHRLDSLANISRFDVVRFYRSTFPYKRDKDPTLYESAIAELVKERHPNVIWDETKHVLRTFVHLAFAKLTEDEQLQREFYSLPDDVQHAYVEFFKSISTFSETAQDEATWDLLYCEKCMEEQEGKFQSPPKRLRRNLSIKEFCGSPQFKRQQEKTQQAKRLLELENEIDEQNFLIGAKDKEIEALSKSVKDLQQKDCERRKTYDDLSDELAALRSQKEKLEQESASFQVKLEAANKRHKREVEETVSRAQDSALAETQERIAGLEKQIRDAERGQRDAERKLLERDTLCEGLRGEVKALAETVEQSTDTVRHLEGELAQSKNRLREQDEEMQELQAFSAGPTAPGTPLSKYLEKDLRSELKDAQKTIEHLRADVALGKETISALEKESFETKAELNRSRDELDSSKNRCQSLSAKVGELAREVSQTKVRGKVLEEENGTHLRRIESLGEETKKLKNGEILLTLKKEELEKELHVLRTKSAADIVSKETCIAEMRAEKSDLEEEISSLTSELEEANAKWASENERRSQVTASLTDTERRLNDADNRIALLEESLQASKKEMQSATSRFQEQEARFKERDAARTADVQALKAKNGKIQAELAQTRKEANELKTSMVDAEANVARLRGEIAAKDHELKNYEHALRAKLELVESTEKRLETARTEGERRDREAEEKILRLEEEAKAATEENETTLAALNEKLVSSDRDSQSLRRELSESRRIGTENGEAARAEIEGLKAVVGEAERDVAGKRAEVEDLKRRGEAAAAEIAAKSDEIEKLGGQLERAEADATREAEEAAELLRVRSEEASSMRDSVERLTLELGQWRSRFGDDAVDVEAKISQLERQKTAAGSRQAELDEKIGELQSAVEALTSEMKDRDAELNEWRSRFGDNVAEGEKKFGRLESESRAAEEEKLRLEERLRVSEETAETRARESESQLAGERERVAALTKSVEDFRSRLEEKSAAASKLAEDAAEGKTLLEEKMNELAETERKLKESEGEKEALKVVVVEKERRIAEDGSVLAEVRAHLEDARRGRNEAERAKEELSEARDREMENAMVVYEESMENMTKEMNAKSAEMANLARIGEETAEALRTKTVETEQTLRRLAEVEELLGRTRRDLEGSESARASEREKFTALLRDAEESRSNERQTHSAELAEKDARMQTQVQQHRAVVEALEREKKTINARLTELASASDRKVEAGRLENEELRRSLAEAEESLVKVSEESARKDAERKSATDDALAARDEAAALKARVETLREQNGTLTTKLNKEREDYERDRGEVDSLKEALRSNQTQLDALEEKNAREIQKSDERLRELSAATEAQVDAQLQANAAKTVEDVAKVREELEARLAKEKAEFEEREKRLNADFAVEKELMQVSNSRMLLNLEKDKKKLEKKIGEVTKAAEEKTKSMEEEMLELKEQLVVIESEKEDLERKVEDLTVENEALVWGGDKENSPEPRGTTFVKDEDGRPVAGDTFSLRSQVSSGSLSGQPPQPRLSSSRKNSQVDLKSQKSSSSLQSSSSNFAAVNELEEDFLGTPLSLLEKEGPKRRETMAFGENFKEQMLAEEDDDDERRRLVELKRRNTLYPSHLQSSYPVETSYCARKINESTLQRGQDTPTTRSKSRATVVSPKKESEAPPAKAAPVAMEFSPPGRAGNPSTSRQATKNPAFLEFSPGPSQGKRAPRRVPRRLGAFNDKSEPSPTQVAEVRPLSSSVNTATITKSFRPFQRANPDEDMFEIIKEATGHRIEDQVYDKPIPNLETPQPPTRPSPPSKGFHKRRKAEETPTNQENASTSAAGPTPTKRTKKGLAGTPMKMLSNLKINTPKTKLKLKGNSDKASSSGPHLHREASALARSQESLNSVGTPSAAERTSQSLNSLNSVGDSTESSLKKGFSLRRKGSTASTGSRASASSQGSEDEDGKKKKQPKSMRRSIMAMIK